MSSLLWTFERDDHPRDGDDFRIWFDLIDGYPVFSGVTEAHSYRAVPELREWAESQFSKAKFIDEAIEIAEEDAWADMGERA